MNKISKFNLKKLPLVLGAAALAVSMLFTVACSDNGNSSSSSSSSSETKVTQTDYQTIANGDFQFGTNEKEAADYPVYTGISWSKSNDSVSSTSATSSSYPSGIIDTNDDVYNAIFTDSIEHKPDHGNPYTPSYYGLVKNEYVYSEDNEDKNDENKYPTLGTKILMIHNYLKSEKGKGTAQKFTSSTTVTVENYGKISVWVKTDNLTTKTETKEFGAYISLTNNAGEQKSPLTVRNINTNGVWERYDLYVEASSYSTSKVKVVLGLGSGSRNLTDGYVEGFAFFDNVTYEEITADEYEAAKGTADATKSIFKLDNGEYVDSTANELKVTLPAKAAHEGGNGTKSDKYVGDEEFAKHANTYSVAITHKLSDAEAILVGRTTELNKVYDDNSVYTNAIYEADYKAFNEITGIDNVTNPVSSTAKTLYINHKGTPVGASTKTTFTIGAGTVEDGKYYMLSFYSKVKAGAGQTGAAISVVEPMAAEGKNSTTVLSAFTTNDYENEKTSDWALTKLFIANKLGDGIEREYKITIDFGTTDEGITEKFKLTTGYALFTGFTLTELPEDEYNIATTSDTYTGSVSLGLDMINGVEEDKTDDSYNFTYGASDNFTVRTSPATSVMNYTGVVGGHKMVGGENTAYTSDDVISGIINTKYIDAYASLGLTADEVAAIKALSKISENKELQPLIIKNTSATSYGYIGSSKTFSSGTTTLVSVKVRVLGTAKAYVYLGVADMLDENAGAVLSLTGEKHDGENGFTKEFVQVVEAKDCIEKGGWATVNFVITAGNADISYRLELWNGSRDGSEKSSGIVLFDEATTSTPSMAEFRAKLAPDAAILEDTPTTISYIRMPSTVQYTDADGKDATMTRTYDAEVVYEQYTKLKTVIATYETIDVEHELDERTSDSSDSSSSSSSSTSTDSETSYSLPLQIVSIVISALMIIAIIIIIVKKIIGAKHRQKVASQIFYQRDSRDSAQDKINANKAKRESAAKAKDEAETTPAEEKPYDYDNPENNVESDEPATEEASEQPATEEASETPKDDGNGENA